MTVEKMNFKSILVVLLLAELLFLTACTKPNIAVETLAKELPAPSLKSGGVSAVDFPESQKYLSFGGDCDKRSQSLKVGFLVENESLSYHAVPSETTYDSAIGSTATPTYVTESNDIDCTDGAFSFKLSKNFIFGILNVATNAELQSKNVVSIYIVGETLLGYTKPLVINVSDGPSQRVATHIRLHKNRPLNAAPQNNCFEMMASLTDGNGNGAELSSATQYKLKNSSNQNVSFYPTWNDCHSSNSGALTEDVVIDSNKQSRAIYIRSTSLTTETYTLAQTNGISLNTSNATLTMNFRNTYSSSTLERYLMFDWNFPHSFKSGFCYPIKLGFYAYSTTIDPLMNRSDISLNITSNLAGTNFYSDASCSTILNNPKISIGTQYLNFYVKHSAASASSDFPRNIISATGSGTDTSSNSLIIDSDAIYPIVDISAETSLQKLSFWLEPNLKTNTCYTLVNDFLNKYHTPTPLSASQFLNINFTGTASFNVYSNGCYDGLISSGINIPSNNYRKFLYVIPTNIGSGSLNTSVIYGGSTITSETQNLSVGSGPIGLRPIYNPVLSIGQCVALDVELYDSSNNAVAPSGRLLMTSLNTGTSNADFYRDSSCGSLINPNSDHLADPNYGVGRFTVYLRAHAALTNQVILINAFNMGSATFNLSTQ